MGVVQKQSAWNSVFSYLGAGLGFLNKVFLLTRFFSEEQVGLANLLVTISLVFAQFSALGFVQITLRFFPFFKDKEKGHHGFLFWSLFFSLIGFGILAGLVIIFDKEILQYYGQNSPLLAKYFRYVLILTFANLIFNVVEAYLKNLLKTVVPNMVREFFLRFMVTVSLLLYVVEWVSFEQFVWIYVGVNSSIAVIILVYTAYLKQLFILPRLSFFKVDTGGNILSYGIVAMILASVSHFAINLDAIMMGNILDEKKVGIYTVVVFLVSFIMIPARSMYRVANTLVAEHWKSGDMKSMQRLYQQVSHVNIVVGSFLFLGVFLNFEDLFSVVREEYVAGLSAFFILGFARLFDMACGLNGIILSTSRAYWLDIPFSIGLFVLAIFNNNWLMPEYGMAGAAMANLITFVAYNVLRLATVGFLYKIQPFQLMSIPVVLIAAASGLAAWYVPEVGNPFIDIPIRSIVFAAIFILPILQFNLAPEINEFVRKILRRVKK